MFFAALEPAKAKDPYGLLTSGAYCWQEDHVVSLIPGFDHPARPGSYYLHDYQSGDATPDGREITASDGQHRLFRVPCPPKDNPTSARWAGLDTRFSVGTGRFNVAYWAGLNAGFAIGTGRFNEGGASTDFNTSGGTVGGTLGIGARFGRNKVGIESDINWSNFSGTSTSNCAVGCGVTNHWFGTVRPLFGVQVTDTGIIPYVTAGLAFGNVTATVNGFPGVSETKVGWTAGGGVAFPLGQWAGGRLVGKVEFLHLDFGSVQCMPATCGGTADVRSTQELFRGGINFSF